jgi:uncharacterized tellurite resistance protein B-like protein
MSNLSNEQKNLYRAVAELAYTIAQTDNEVSPIEVEAFRNAIKITLGDDNWFAHHHFDVINKSIHPNIETSYKHAIDLIEKNKGGLSRLLIRKFIYVLERVAEVMGISEEERNIINRFEDEVLQIHASKKTEMNQFIDSEESNLYSTVGQLAYVMAMADHVMLDEERDAFRTVIKENLGNFDWLAEDRFKVIDELMVMDVENTYDHAIFLIKKNVEALDEKLIQKFINVITKVAEVAGIVPAEQEIINQFTQDIQDIYYRHQKKG